METVDTSQRSHFRRFPTTTLPSLLPSHSSPTRTINSGPPRTRNRVSAGVHDQNSHPRNNIGQVYAHRLLSSPTTATPRRLFAMQQPQHSRGTSQVTRGRPTTRVRTAIEDGQVHDPARHEHTKHSHVPRTSKPRLFARLDGDVYRLGRSGVQTGWIGVLVGRGRVRELDLRRPTSLRSL